MKPTTAARRVARMTRLTEALGHTDVIDALKHAEEMRSALRVIHTWAGVPGALDARHVRGLIEKALHMGANAELWGAPPTGGASHTNDVLEG